eukprot:scaffold17670_cov99-Cyclotella_meneghiniana.AAC.1
MDGVEYRAVCDIDIGHHCTVQEGKSKQTALALTTVDCLAPRSSPNRLSAVLSRMRQRRRGRSTNM